MHLYLRDPRRPCFPNPFDLCNKSPTRDFARFASATCNSYWSVFVRPVERISQKMDIRHLKCSESLSILNQRPSYSCAECSWECSIVEIRSFTGFSSPSLNPITCPSAIPSFPNISTTIQNLIPVPVSQPQQLNRSSTACRSPKS